MDTAVSVELFVEILNRYVYYFDQQNEAVSLESLLILEEHIDSCRLRPNTSMVSLSSSTQTCKPTKNQPQLRCQSVISREQ